MLNDIFTHARARAHLHTHTQKKKYIYIYITIINNNEETSFSKLIRLFKDIYNIQSNAINQLQRFVIIQCLFSLINMILVTKTIYSVNFLDTIFSKFSNFS